MKKLRILYFAIVWCLAITPNSTQASHGMGGEITWTCLGNGQFQFQLKFYRDCSGIPAPTSINMTTTVPGVPTISMVRIQINDISPVGLVPAGNTSCPTCANGTPNVGLVEEDVYQSAPVTLNGVPPATGWMFYWGECCRSGSINNIVNPGTIGFRLRAIMYPYQGQNTYPCFDSSPSFAEKPSVIQCTNLSMNYQHLSYDSDYDSMSYNLVVPLTDTGTPVTWSPNFNTNNPLPGALTLNSQNGQMAFTPNAGGYYALAVGVSSYKCGIKVSEVFREINVVLNSNCPNTGGVPNLAPNIVPPFIDSLTGLQTSYSDTVFAGDTVSFQSVISDFQTFDNGIPQTVTASSFGGQYGAGFTDPNAGCLLPPCATLSPAPPSTGQLSAITGFNWVTAPIHLGLSFNCVNMANTYYFIWKGSDNYCPANGTNSQVISITVLPNCLKPQIISNGPVLTCSLSGNYTYQWFFERFAISGANTATYIAQQPGTYHVLAVQPNGDGNYSNGFVYNAVGMEEIWSLSGVLITPNPSANGIFELSGIPNDTRIEYEVVDVSGRLVLQGVHDSNTSLLSRIDLSQKGKGFYLLKLTDTDGKHSTKKIMRL